MTTFRPLVPLDLLQFNNINLDHFTETFHSSFYLNYLTKWPECCIMAENIDGTLAGYLIGKVEGIEENWHSHVSALSVAPEFRRTGLAKRLMSYFEEISEEVHDAYFCDLFVRESNAAAVEFYKSCGYVVYRIVKGYYSGQEDALDMRKPLRRDKDQRSIAHAGLEVSAADVL
jgi:N-terminal acetyltransferase B complex catalytic subunit